MDTFYSILRIAALCSGPIALVALLLRWHFRSGRSKLSCGHKGRLRCSVPVRVGGGDGWFTLLGTMPEYPRLSASERGVSVRDLLRPPTTMRTGMVVCDSEIEVLWTEGDRVACRVRCVGQPMYPRIAREDDPFEPVPVGSVALIPRGIAIEAIEFHDRIKESEPVIQAITRDRDRERERERARETEHQPVPAN